jgi:hypothetical protein
LPIRLTHTPTRASIFHERGLRPLALDAAALDAIA